MGIENNCDLVILQQYPVGESITITSRDSPIIFMMIKASFLIHKLLSIITIPDSMYPIVQSCLTEASSLPTRSDFFFCCFFDEVLPLLHRSIPEDHRQYILGASSLHLDKVSYNYKKKRQYTFKRVK